MPRRKTKVPFEERVTATRSEVLRHFALGNRKLNEIIDEGLVDAVVVDHRKHVIVKSLLGYMKARLNLALPEPPQLSRAKTKQEVR
jgi:hypothetical protein